MSKELMTAGEVADYLRLSVKSIYERVQRHALPFVRIGDSRTIRFRRKDMEEMIKDGHVPMERRGGGG
ncbi:MAG TPA: helix-turn-helix domain-containing protein [bacterium]|nr:helix-turn-helix domain-containing protein [bacterium]